MRLPSESFMCFVIAIVVGMLAIGLAVHEMLKTQTELNLLEAQNYASFLNKQTLPGGGPPGAAGKFCGGIAGFPCQKGYTCKLDGTYPDAGGRCVRSL